MIRLVPFAAAAAALALGACANMDDTAVNPRPTATGANISDDSSAARVTNETSSTSGAVDPGAGRGSGGSGGSTGGGATGVTGNAPPSSTP
jgi:hypothetical protein